MQVTPSDLYPLAHQRHQVVARDSAVPDNEVGAVKLHKDHVNMVKFHSTSDDDYRSVMFHLRNVIADGTDEQNSMDTAGQPGSEEHHFPLISQN